MTWGRPDDRSGVASTTSALVSWLQVPALNPGPAIDIAGESHYQDALEQVGGGRSAFGARNQLITVELVREPTNPHAVKIQADGHHLGYLPTEDAPRFHAVIDRLTAKDRPATCRARPFSTGGTYINFLLPRTTPAGPPPPTATTTSASNGSRPTTTPTTCSASTATSPSGH